MGCRTGLSVIEMNIIFTREWFYDFYRSINSNARYEEEARDWEGDILFIIRGDGNSGNLKRGVDMLVRLDLFHGKCRTIDFPSGDSDIRTQYSLDGSASDWEEIISGGTDLVSSVMRGKVRIEGNTMKLMRYLSAAEELINTAREVPRL